MLEEHTPIKYPEPQLISHNETRHLSTIVSALLTAELPTATVHQVYIRGGSPVNDLVYVLLLPCFHVSVERLG